MGKRIAVILLFALMLVFSILQNSFLRHTAQSLTAELSVVNEAVKLGDRDAALKSAKDAKDIWDTKALLLSILLAHREVDQVESDMTDMLIYLENGDFTEAQVSIGSILLSFEHMVSSDSPSAKIIF